MVAIAVDPGATSGSKAAAGAGSSGESFKSWVDVLRRLIAEASRHAKASGDVALTALADDDNAAALSVYASTAFEAIGRTDIALDGESEAGTIEGTRLLLALPTQAGARLGPTVCKLARAAADAQLAADDSESKSS